MTAANDRLVAIVGMSCRLPGAPGIETFWENLRSGVESVRTFSDEELLAAGVSAEALSDPRWVKAGALVDGTDLFDHGFFGLNRREAEIMDPQHRVFLECAWEALERAGCDPDTCEGLIGVYASAGANTYAWNNLRPNQELLAALGEFRVMVGNDKDFLPTQTSYRLDLRGPSVAVQTACSSSLVAVHLACQGLLDYDCDVALAGGVHLLVPQRVGYRYDEGGILSPDGRCRAFDAQAAGTAMGEGCGVVVLKRLRDALADGDPVHAVILGSAINNDGAHKVGFTAPSEDGQADVIATALGTSGVGPETVSYVEAHGTGTALGDPIEVAALTQVFRTGAEGRGFCALGSVKTNIGHLDVAAGVTGLIKAALALEHRTIPPSLNFSRPNPKIDFANSPFYVATEAAEWRAEGFPRRAGVSSFGIGGTNAHVVLEEAPARSAAEPARPWQILPLSARTPAALAAAADRLADHLERHPGLDLADVAATLGTGRRGFEHRRFVVCRGREEAVAALRAADPASGTGRARGRNRPVFFLFPGQGAQHVGMARGLYDEEPAFREPFEECARLLRPALGLDLAELLTPAPADEAAAERLRRTRFAQPALFAVEYALAKLWMEWGITPEGMLGHSVGEYVAACLAGVMTLPSALALVAARGRLMEGLPEGAMLSVPAGKGEVRPLLGADLSLAAVNSPSRTVVSGPAAAVEDLRRELTARGLESRLLATSHAFHSAMMEPVLEAFAAEVGKVRLAPPELRYVSNLTGIWIAPEQATDPAYWTAHLRRTVLFSQGVSTLLEVPDGVFLEVGPGRTLTTFVGQHRRDEGEPVLVTSLRHPRDGAADGASLRTALGRLWAAGAAVSWRGYFGREERRKVALPTYPFERQRCWIDPPAARPSLLPGTLPAASAEPLEPAPGERYLVTDGSAGAGRAFAEAASRRGATAVLATGPDLAEAAAGGFRGVVHPLRAPGGEIGVLVAELERLRSLDRALAGRKPACVLLCAPPPDSGPGRRLAESLVLAAADFAAARGAGWRLAAPAAADWRPEDFAAGAGDEVLESGGEPDLDEVEKSIAAVWREQLGGQRIGWEDDFFELGGDSLLATRTVARLGEVHGVALPLGALFEVPTVRGLAARIHELKAAGAEASAARLPQIAPDPAARWEPFPLNDQQQAYWVGRNQGFDLGNVATHIYQEVESDTLDLARFEAVWQRMIARHDTLRLVVSSDGRQRILREVPPYRIAVADFAGRPDAEAALAVVRTEMSHQKLVPERWPLFEIRASLLDGGRIRLHVSIDGLILDGWSLEILFSEVVRCYVDEALPLPDLTLSFRDYVLAGHALRSTEAYRLSREHWLRRLAELPPAPQLPLAIQPSALAEPRFRRFHTELEPAAWGRLKARAAHAGLTPNGILLAAYAAVLGRFSRNRRFTLNVPRFNRLPLHPEVDAILGEFASFTLVAVEPRPGTPFVERARALQRQLWENLDHALISGVEILRELRRLQGNALEAVMPVVFTSDPRGEGQEDERTLATLAELGRLVEGVSQTAQVWLDNQVSQHGGALSVVWDAVEALFPPGLLETMFETYRSLLLRLADEPGLWEAAELGLLPAGQAAWLAGLADMDAPLPDGLLQDRFASWALREPHRPAVVTSGRALGYGELFRLATRLGRLLRREGARPDTLVAVVMEKGWEQVAGVLGTLFAGAAYLPVDAALPRQRLGRLLEQAGTQLVLTQSHLDAALEWPEGVRRFAVDTLDLAEVSDEPLAPAQGPEHLAYIIFTSGSTGQPKGAMIAQRGAVNAVLATNERFAVGPDDRAIALTALHHDMSVYDIFGPLSAGGALVIPDAAGRLDPAHWSELMLAHRVTIWNSVPAILEMFLESVAGRAERVPQSLRLAFLGGDWIALDLPDRLRALAPGAQVVSVGGPTETTLWNIWYPVERVDPAWRSIPYGKPIRGNRYYVLDEELEPCPVWVPGQLCCAGCGVARGYWRDEERTAASFFLHPRTGERLYRTGDIGRVRPDGNIEFLGREDFQVKIRGHRIELGEIETALRQLAEVRSAVVTAGAPPGAPPGARRLVAYVVPAPGAAPTAESLRAGLREQLPEAMVPAAYVLLDALPLTSNGKVDRSRLPAPEESAPRSAPPAAPASELERAVAEVWQEVLGAGGFGIDDNFFDLGGNSYLMIQAQGRLGERLGRELSVAELFEHTTVRSLAQHLRRQDDAQPVVQRGRERAEARRGAIRERAVARH